MSTATKDLYSVLGVSRTATEKEIRQAYRRLARQLHPDVNPRDKQAAERFKEANRAYEVLSDAEKRKLYDRYGADWEQAQRFEKATGQPFESAFREPFRQGSGFRSWGFGPGRAEGHFGDLDSEDLGDLFGDLFGGVGARGATATRPRRSQDLEHPLEVTLEEAFQGASRMIEMQGASGHARRLEVKIPPGVDTGSRVRIAGAGEPAHRGSPAGDLYLIITVEAHPRFRRQGADLHADVPVPLATAVLGGEVEVPTLKGRVALRIPPETQNGQVFRMAGQGMPRLRDRGRGDLFAKALVQLPTRLTPEERALFERLRALRPAG